MLERRLQRDKTTNQQGRTTLREIGKEETDTEGATTEGATIEGIGITIEEIKDTRGPAPRTEGMLITRRRGIGGTPMGAREVPEKIPKNVTKKAMKRSVRKTKRTSKRSKRSSVMAESRKRARKNLPKSLKIEMISFKPQIRRRRKTSDRCLIKSKKLSLKPQPLLNKSKMFQTPEDKMISRSLRLSKDFHLNVITTVAKKIEGATTAVTTVHQKTTSR
jgi:hypothetical protein